VAKTKTKTKKTTSPRSRSGAAPAYRLRRSPVHGTGLFATRAIPKGERILEYTGERISHDEADRRHANKADDDNHTFLFTIDEDTVIDGGVGGNDSRLINHSCDPNCEVIISDGRPLVEAVRAVSPGEELAYDYNLTREPGDSPEIERIFACRCGAATCRGTMLTPPRKPKAEAKASGKGRATPSKARAKPRAKASAKPRTKASAKPRTKASAKPRAKASAKPRTKASAKPSKARAKASAKRRAAPSKARVARR
jgi:hypothetical protein